MSKGKILLIDDDAEFREATRALLESEDYEVHEAGGGQAGIALAHELHPDLIILDVMMSTDTEGFDVSRDLQDSELSSTPVILLTGIKRAMRLPFQFEPDEEWLPVKAVLEKPVPPTKLVAEVAKHIG